MLFSAQTHQHSIPAAQVSGATRSGGKAGVKSTAKKPLVIGTQVDNYVIGRAVGSGSFSIVYKGRNLDNDQGVIVKEYFPGRYARRLENAHVRPYGGKRLMAFSEGFRQFLNEALALVKVNHPNVIEANDFFHANGTAYLVSPDTGGRCLKWFAGSQKEPLEQNLLLEIILPVMSALNYMHEAQLVHLDVKPNNILLQPNGQPLLLDFGAAWILNSGAWEDRKQTLTPGFAPPELYDKSKQPGAWSDVYALGATLYYCIVGKTPAQAIENDSMISLDDKCWGGLYDTKMLRAINRAMMFDPLDRYMSVDEFAEGLLQGTPWSNLADYELQVMNYDRSVQSTRDSQDEVLRLVA